MQATAPAPKAGVRRISKIDRILVVVLSIAAFVVIFRTSIAGLNTWRGDQFAMNGKRAEAIPSYRKALLLDPGAVEPRLSLAAQYFSTADYSAADEQYRIALELSPKNDEAHYYLGLMGMRRRDWPSAARHLSRVRASADFGPLALRLLARVYEEDGRIQPAIDTWRRLGRTLPSAASDVRKAISRLEARLASEREGK